MNKLIIFGRLTRDAKLSKNLCHTHSYKIEFLIMRLTTQPINGHLTEIKLHQVSKILEISFADGSNFKLPCEYLRVYSQSAEAVGHGSEGGQLPVGKEAVTITEIKPIGNYAIAPVFNDGHDSGIYTWELLYKLGAEYETLWAAYLNDLKAAGHQRTSSANH